MIRSFSGITPNVHEKSYIDPSAQVIGDVVIEEDVSVWPLVTLRGDDSNYIKVGKGSNIQDNSVCHVTPDNPVLIGENVTIGHGVILHACTIEDEALIGMGATVLDGAVIEKGAQVGANALVPPGKVIPSGKLAVGVPAKVVRELTESEIQDMKDNALEYQAMWKKYLEEELIDD